MKQIIIIIAAIIFPAIISAEALDDIVARADSAYNGQRYTDAATLYTLAIDSCGPSAALYYNLGNCYYRLNRPGKAILNYNRALRLDPTDSDAAENLDFVTSRLPDRIGQRGSFIANSIDTIARLLTSDTWAYIALAAFILTVAAVLLYIFNSNVLIRKTGFFGGGILLLITIITILLSIRGAAIARADNAAVVTAQSTILSTVPRTPASPAEEAMMLHEGATLTILDSVSVTTDSVTTTWLDVLIDNDHRAWINAAHTERI